MTSENIPALAGFHILSPIFEGLFKRKNPHRDIYIRFCTDEVGEFADRRKLLLARLEIAEDEFRQNLTDKINAHIVEFPEYARPAKDWLGKYAIVDSENRMKDIERWDVVFAEIIASIRDEIDRIDAPDRP